MATPSTLDALVAATLAGSTNFVLDETLDAAGTPAISSAGGTGTTDAIVVA